MKQEINPKETSRAMAFELWMKSPMPMVTLTKTFDVTRLCRVSRRRGLKFNMLLCWCIGKTASRIEEFYMLPHDGKLYKYDRMAVNMIINNIKGGLSFCDIAVTDDLEHFNANYLHLTETIRQTCQNILDEDAVIVGTSTLTGTELDCIVNQYSGIFTNPFLAWGRYRKGWLKTTLPISFQFHHAQMDGSHAARHGLKTDEIGAMVFILTGMKGVRFRQLYQMRLCDDLLRYTDLPFDEVARRSGLGSPNNMYLALRREYNMSATERRYFLRKEGDEGRYKV